MGGSIFRPFFWNGCQVRFSYIFHHGTLCKGPRTLRKFPQKCQKIAGCWECAVYGSRPLIASTTGSSPPERPGSDNIMSQPWSDATCPCNTASSYLSCLYKQRAWQSESKHFKRWYEDKLRQTMVDSWWWWLLLLSLLEKLCNNCVWNSLVFS